MGAKGCNGRGGNANGKKYEGRRHGGNGGGKGKRRRASASRVEKAHETVERRVGKAAIEEAMQEGMAHGIEAYNEAIGSPLGGQTYCPHCLKDYGSGHHSCDCDTDEDE